MTTAARPRRRPEGRYDEPPSLPRWALVTGAVLALLVGVGATYAAYDKFSGGRAQYGTRGYEVVDDRTVRVTFEVGKDVRDTLRCVVNARDARQVVVGERTVDVGPSDRSAVITTTTVTTSSRAATAEVVRCRVVTP